VTVHLDNPSGTLTTRPIYILLPFKIENDLQLKIQDDLTYTFKVLSKKYTLINAILDTSQKNLAFSVQSVNNNIITIEGRSKIDIDFSYLDVPKNIYKSIEENIIIHKFNVQWKTPRKLTLEEISSYPSGLFAHDSANSFDINFSELEKRSTKNTWFVYPNFKVNSDQSIQFYLLLLIGLFSAITQLNFIFDRKLKILNIEAIISFFIIAVVCALHILLPPSATKVVRMVAAPIVPSIFTILVGVLFLKITENRLWKISGIIKNETGEPLAYADVELFHTTQNLSNDNEKPFKKMDQLTNGRFEFTLLQKSPVAYKLKISKTNRETKIIEIPVPRDKSYELPFAITLQEVKG
jgi:hypothetical protein